jgi:hypothetical protein
MTIDHPVRRLLARVCSAETMSRIVDPVLADMREEPARPRWRGYLALIRALTLHAVLCAPGAVARLWSDDGHAVPRALATGSVTAALLAASLVVPPAMETRWISWRTLVPQGLSIALPPSLLVAIPFAFRHVTMTRHLVVRGLTLSALCALGTFVVMNRLMPDANQAFREEVSAKVALKLVHLERGPNEMALRELRARIDTVRLTPGGERAARRLEYVYQQRLVLAAIAIPLGTMAIAVTLSARGRAHPLLMGACSFVAYLLTIFPSAALAERLTASSPAVPAGLFAWIPLLAVSALAAVTSGAVLRPAR